VNVYTLAVEYKGAKTLKHLADWQELSCK